MKYDSIVVPPPPLVVIHLPVVNMIYCIKALIIMHLFKQLSWGLSLRHTVGMHHTTFAHCSSQF